MKQELLYLLTILSFLSKHTYTHASTHSEGESRIFELCCTQEPHSVVPNQMNGSSSTFMSLPITISTALGNQRDFFNGPHSATAAIMASRMPQYLYPVFSIHFPSEKIRDRLTQNDFVDVKEKKPAVETLRTGPSSLPFCILGPNQLLRSRLFAVSSRKLRVIFSRQTGFSC